jgi:hypothetical protein
MVDHGSEHGPGGKQRDQGSGKAEAEDEAHPVQRDARACSFGIDFIFGHCEVSSSKRVIRKSGTGFPSDHAPTKDPITFITSDRVDLA